MTGHIVSNTGPIIALTLIDRLDILNSLFQIVTVSDMVHKELLAGGASGYGLVAYQKASWIKVQAMSTAIDPLLRTVLDLGEASVIQLAREINADCVLIDERKARKVARDIYGMKVIGTARLLVEAKREGILDSVQSALLKMRDGGYRIHDDIIGYALKEAKER